MNLVHIAKLYCCNQLINLCKLVLLFAHGKIRLCTWNQATSLLSQGMLQQYFEEEGPGAIASAG